MAKRKSESTWSDVKSQLTGFTPDGLIGLVHDLYAASKANQTFLHTRFALGPDPLQAYKDELTRWLWPDIFRQQSHSVAKAKKANADDRKATGDAAGVAELMVSFCEQASGFASAVGLDDAGFYDALVRMDDRALEALAPLPERSRVILLARLNAVREVCGEIDWGVSDDMADLLVAFARSGGLAGASQFRTARSGPQTDASRMANGGSLEVGLTGSGVVADPEPSQA